MDATVSLDSALTLLVAYKEATTHDRGRRVSQQIDKRLFMWEGPYPPMRDDGRSFTRYCVRCLRRLPEWQLHNEDGFNVCERSGCKDN